MVRYDKAGFEPALDELLDDPVMELVFSRDGIGRQDVLRAVSDARANWSQTVAENATIMAAGRDCQMRLRLCA